MPDSVPDSFQSQRLPGLDTLRALAIVAVMFFHLGGYLPQVLYPATRLGWAGVDLFFALSGYLIGGQLLRPVARGRRPDLRAFYRKRAYRILPAYLLVLAIYLVWSRFREGGGMQPVWQFLTFTTNLFIDYPQNSTFSHAWSLCVEEHFYLLLPAMVLLLARKPSVRKTSAVLLAVLLGGIALRAWLLLHTLRPAAHSALYFQPYMERIYYPSYSRLDGLLAGVSVALLELFRPAGWLRLSRYRNGILLLGSAVVAAALSMFHNRFVTPYGMAGWSTVVGYPLLSLGLGLLVLSAAMPGSWLARARVPGARWVAGMAFSLYLTHKAVAHLLNTVAPVWMEAHPWGTMAVLFPVCFAAAAALYYGVELPFLRLRDRRAHAQGRPSLESRTEPAL